MQKTLLAASLMTALSSSAVFANQETDELRALIAEQKKALEALERRLEASEKRAELVADAVESQQTASKSATTIGGYGELHYNNITNNKTDEKTREMDFHRFVLFFNHEFDSKTRFVSELELEHALAGEGKHGEVELEQAYVEHDFSDTVTAKAGLFLMPIGLINETHEPPTFYGVERNPVEKDILPTTWWEAGIGANFKLAPGLALDTAITSGLATPVDGSNAFKIRNGRQKVSEATANDLAYTARIRYTAIPGLELGASVVYQSDLRQGTLDDAAAATLFTAHGVYTVDQFSVRALFAQWNVDGADAAAVGRDKQTGYYIEPSYKLNNQFGVFARYSAWDNNAGDSADTEKTQTNIGINYWLHEDVVLKFDIESQGGAADADGFNLGVGYQF